MVRGTDMIEGFAIQHVRVRGINPSLRLTPMSVHMRLLMCSFTILDKMSGISNMNLDKYKNKSLGSLSNSC